MGLQGAAVRSMRAGDLAWAEELLDAALGGRHQVRRDELIDVLDLPGLIAERDGTRVGLLTYRPEHDGAELAVVAAVVRQVGVGTALLNALTRELAGRGRLWLVTTNDNLEALRFYQRRGFVLVALRPGTIAEARRGHKPSLPAEGAFGIPLRDELELELSL